MCDTNVITFFLDFSSHSYNAVWDILTAINKFALNHASFTYR